MTTPPVAPKPLRILDLEMEDGALIRVRQHGNPLGPRLFVSHGNGFATDGYHPFWRHLCECCEVLVYDQRNHGQNPRHDMAHHEVAQFVRDLDTLLREIPKAFGDKTPSGVFHSLSAIVAVAHALERPWPWAGLVLFDPPFSPEPSDALFDASRAEEKALSEHATGRRSHFSNPEELAGKFARGMAGPGWVEGAYLEMARAVLRESPEGGYELACPGPFEGKVFADNSNLELSSRLGELRGPVFFLCADPERPGALLPARVNQALHQRFRHPYEAPAGTSHMLMLEEPERCAELTLRFLRAAWERS